MKCRKKPIVIVEAVKYDGGLIRESEYPKWFLEAVNDGIIEVTTSIMTGGRQLTKITYSLSINTLEGKLLVSNGDYIIKGVNGEIYPCKPDIFEKAYEKVMEENS